MTISNDMEFKSALSRLSRAGQRQVAARFAESVLALCPDPRVGGAINSAKRTDVTEAELKGACQAAKAVSVESFTRCGHECDWHSQAAHFVAEAVLACVKTGGPGGNPAWDTAMHARMARTCETIATGRGTDNSEPSAQYRILAEFLNT